MKPVRFLPIAREELLDAMLDYESRAPHLGTSFLLRLEQAVESVREHPAAWPQLRPGIRHKLLPRFPYAVIYREDPDEIVVLAVMHMHRRPEYWKDRS